MARSRVPTNVLQLRGAGKVHPERMRARKGEPVVTEPIGEPPDRMSEGARQCWHEIVSLTPSGLLTRMDRPALEMAANLYANLISRNWNAQPSELARFEILLGKFGMTPADRSRVSVPKGKEKNAFDDL